MSDRSSLIQQICVITDCNDYQASLVLERSNWDVERAMNSFFDDPPPKEPLAPSATQISSTAVVPFQVADNQNAASGWDVPFNPDFAPPSGAPPGPIHGWGPDKNDVIDLTNDTDADDDLRRAMEASLQDHQSQHTHRPPAPSSTVGVSDQAATHGWSSRSRSRQTFIGKGPLTVRQIDNDDNESDLKPVRLPLDAQLSAIFDEDECMHNRKAIPQQSAEDHGYRLRDRHKLVRPTNTVQTLFEMGRCPKVTRTYGDRASRGRRPRGAGQGRRGRNARRSQRGWSTDIGMSEDEQLRQALEASVQSHHDLLLPNGSGARTPALPQHLETDLQSRRLPGAPVAMVAPFASLDVVAALLQALFAAPPVRRAYLAARPADQRGPDLSSYWKGAPPTETDPDAPAPLALEAHFELAQRIQTLFAFSQLSQRPVCVVKDVTSLTPSEIYARGADWSPPIEAASLFYDFLVESWTKHVAAISELILNNPTAQPVETDALWMTDALFLSSGAAALTSPASPRANGSQTPKIEQQRSFIQLRHDSVNSDTYSCLRAALASDGEGALLTRTAHTISMGLDHALFTSDVGTPPPFTINERIHLDSLMWDRRQGVRLDSELRNLEIVRLDALRQELETRKRKLMGDAGRPLSDVLAGTRRYFEEIAPSVDGGSDAIRASSLAEAAPQMTKIVDAIQADIVGTDKLIARIRAQIDAKRALVAERAKREAANPEWTQLAYDLVAVLCHEAGRCVSLVKQGDGSWWKVTGGKAVRIEKENVIMGRPQDPSLSVFWLVYVRVEDEQGTTGEVEEVLVGEAMKAAIADDNLTYESELLSLIQSDAATPSPTVDDEIQLVQGPKGEKLNGIAATAQGNLGDVTMYIDPDIEVRTEEAPRSPRAT